MQDNQALQILGNLWQKVELDSESKRLSDYNNLYIYYINDKEEIENYLKSVLVYEKGLYSEETWKKIIVRHRDNIQKILNRLTVGIYENPPVRELYTGETLDETNSAKLNDLLESVSFNETMKQAFKAGKYFNCLEGYVTWDKENNKCRLELITPESYSVNVKPNDYLSKSKIYIQKYNSDKNEIYFAVWSDTEHYFLDGSGNIFYLEGNEQGKNPYKKIPAIKLQFQKGIEYFGEPNWDLFDTQFALDVKMTNNLYTEMFEGFSVAVGTNLPMKEGQVLSPGMVLNSTNVKEGDIPPDLKFITPGTDFKMLTDSLDFEVKDCLRAQGINAATSSLETSVQSGRAKEIDELELREQRETSKETIYKFEYDLINLLIEVNNYNDKSNQIKGDLYIEFSEESVAESSKDKIERRKFNLENHIETPIDFIMQDKEVSNEEAQKIYEENLIINKPVLPDGNINNNQNNNLNNG